MAMPRKDSQQEPAEATMRNCHGSAVGILAIHGEEDVNWLRYYETGPTRTNGPVG
jgi:hypothetical protein